MEEHHERRKNDERLAELETRMAVGDNDHITIKETLVRIELKLDRYNGIREKLESAQKELTEHKSEHWKFGTMVVAIAGLIVTIIKRIG